MNKTEPMYWIVASKQDHDDAARALASSGWECSLTKITFADGSFIRPDPGTSIWTRNGCTYVVQTCARLGA